MTAYIIKRKDRDEFQDGVHTWGRDAYVYDDDDTAWRIASAEGGIVIKVPEEVSLDTQEQQLVDLLHANPEEGLLSTALYVHKQSESGNPVSLTVEKILDGYINGYTDLDPERYYVKVPGLKGKNTLMYQINADGTLGVGVFSKGLTLNEIDAYGLSEYPRTLVHHIKDETGKISDSTSKN